jgi:quinolinate synthase
VIGDSLALSRAAAKSDADLILFCGVRFMAESAAVLAKSGQRVIHPEPSSGCPMSDMADEDDVERALEELDGFLGEGKCIPVTYVNSSAAVKAATGRKGGICCTSSNAARVLEWALAGGKKVLFLPDEYLGRNTARKLGIPPRNILPWDYSLPLGGNAPETVRDAQLMVWKGYCHVHTYFNEGHVLAARKRFPQARIVVHPECSPEVVMAADASGSTESIVRHVRDSGPGSTVVVGTELNLIRRLAVEYADRTVVELARSFCPNMFKITAAKVLEALNNPRAARLAVGVDAEVRMDAGKALERMLEIS